MQKKLIIFGDRKHAEVVYYYFSHDTDYEVIGFCVDGDYITQDRFHDLPVFPFEDIENHIDPTDTEFFLGLSYGDVNRFRAQKYNEIKAKKYSFASYISSKASVYTDDIGENVYIMENAIIEPYCKIGNNVALGGQCSIGHHSIIEDHCFVAGNAVVSGSCTIGKGSFIGANATIRTDMRIGGHNIIGAGVTILSDTDDNAIYRANEGQKLPFPSSVWNTI